jgi:hypothetical protein
LINNLPIAENRPIDVNENRPSEHLPHGHKRHTRISNKEIEQLAIDVYQKNGRGITYKDVMAKFFCKTKKAQRKLMNTCIETINNNGKKTPILFRPFKRTHPQQFYPYSKRTKIIEKWENNKNRPLDPTVLNHPYPNPYFEKLKVRNVTELLSLLDKQPISIHKLQLKLFVDKNYYNEIDIKQITKGNKSKPREEKFGPRNVKYEVYPCGTIMIYIACSNNPFKLEVEEDVSSFFSFLGQVKDRLIHFLSDFSEQAIPQIMDWILVQCDINKDIGINIVEQLSLPDLQLRVYDRIFRLYVNNINGCSSYRLEESRQVNQEMRFAIPEIMANSNTSYHSYYDWGKFQYIQ